MYLNASYHPTTLKTSFRRERRLVGGPRFEKMGVASLHI